MKFSIVTISFNQARFLEQAILSVLSQDYPDLEYIVVDAGSTDGSQNIIERYRNRIDKRIFEPDNGPAHGLNKGFRYATGDVYGFINSDDALLPGALTRAARSLSTNRDIDVVSGHLYQVDEYNRLIRRLRANPFHPKRFVFGGVQVAQQSTFFRADAFNATVGFNGENRTNWDAELFLEMALQGRTFTIVDEFLALFRVYQGTITANKRLGGVKARNRTRCFERVMGRPPGFADKFLKEIYRIDKWRRDPVGLAMRLYDASVLPWTPKVLPMASLE